MGGNVKIGDISAVPFKINECNRFGFIMMVRSFTSDLDYMYYKSVGHYIWNDRVPYSGSTKHLMDTRITDSEFCRHKDEIGDIDILVDSSHRKELEKLFEYGKRIGSYIVVGLKRHGLETSLLCRNSGGDIHQFDLVYVDDAEIQQAEFLHSSDWEDIKEGIKGVHHKLLLNAAGGEHYKFSITHGLRRRDIEQEKGITSPQVIHYALFGTKCPVTNVLSFKGIVESIEKMPVRGGVSREEMNRAIYDKFIESCLKIKNVDHKPAIDYLERII